MLSGLCFEKKLKANDPRVKVRTRKGTHNAAKNLVPSDRGRNVFMKKTLHRTLKPGASP